LDNHATRSPARDGGIFAQSDRFNSGVEKASILFAGVFGFLLDDAYGAYDCWTSPVFLRALIAALLFESITNFVPHLLAAQYPFAAGVIDRFELVVETLEDRRER
jgi:hypothetical protein